MSIVSSSFLSMKNPPKKLLSGLVDSVHLLSPWHSMLAFDSLQAYSRHSNRSSNSRLNATETPLSVRASAGAGRPTSATVFIGGLISFGGTASWNIRLHKTRKILTEKIAQLNCAIDDASAQLHEDDPSNGATVNLE
ncbi:Uncharacterized protein TCM_000037 [Theobroma cacao]|uniref:Uncharacterized protein n=1 Tax=Theobroma cacao TaxID=3641 RepID=A0A061DF23_THECC|nr:Uncharacterized protein TCM_000037 [Theobroma cacao]